MFRLTESSAKVETPIHEQTTSPKERKATCHITFYSLIFILIKVFIYLPGNL